MIGHILGRAGQPNTTTEGNVGNEDLEQNTRPK